MNYIHNIVLNFNENLYEYYEWETSDKIIHIKKIPIFKVNKNDYFNIKNNIIKLDKTFLNLICKKTHFYSKIKNHSFLCLIGFNEEVIALKLNINGLISEKSHLLINEERSVLKLINKINSTNIKYEIIKDNQNSPYLTRIEKEEIKKAVLRITKLYKNKDYDKLFYLYLECFNKSEKNIALVYGKLIHEIYINMEIKNKVTLFFNILKQK